MKPLVIKEPIWKDRSVGIHSQYVKHDKLTIHIDYRNKADKLEFPHVYEVTHDQMAEAPTMAVAGGTIILHLVKIAEMKIVGNREKKEEKPTKKKKFNIPKRRGV